MKRLTPVMLLMLTFAVRAPAEEAAWEDPRAFSLGVFIGASGSSTGRVGDERFWTGLDFGGRVRFFLEDYRYLGVEYRYLPYFSEKYEPAEIGMHDVTAYLGVSWWGEPGDWRLDFAMNLGFTYYAFEETGGKTDSLELRVGAFIGPEYHLGGPLWLTARLTGFKILTADYTPGVYTGEQPSYTFGIQTGVAFAW